MVRISRIYTRSGDDGTTGLLGSTRVAKNHLRVAAYGDVDEINAQLGSVHAWCCTRGYTAMQQQVEQLQRDLFDIGALLATPQGESHASLPTIEDVRIARLEQWIDQITEKLPVLRSFVLPGGCELNARLHIARAVCRRAERSLIALHHEEPLAEALLRYINRLSDLLFAMARHASTLEGAEELLWQSV